MSSSGTSVPTLSSGAVPELGFAVGASCAAKSAVALVLLRHGRNGTRGVFPWLGEERDSELGGAGVLFHVQSRIDPCCARCSAPQAAELQLSPSAIPA